MASDCGAGSRRRSTRSRDGFHGAGPIRWFATASTRAPRSAVEHELAQLYLQTDRYEELLSLSAERLARGAGDDDEWRQFVDLAAGTNRTEVVDQTGRQLAQADPMAFLAALPHLASTGRDYLGGMALRAVEAVPTDQFGSGARALMTVRHQVKFRPAIDRLIERSLSLSSLANESRSLLEWQLLDCPERTAAETAATVRSCLQHVAADPRLLLAAARAAQRIDDPRLQSQLLETLVRDSNGDVQLLERAAAALARSGQWELAVERQRQALAARGVLRNGQALVAPDDDSESRAAVLRLVSWLQRVARADEAERLVVQRAEHPAARLNDLLLAADVLLTNGHADRSRYLYRRVLGASRPGARVARPDAISASVATRGRAWLGLARSDAALGDPGRAVRWLERAVRSESLRRIAQVELAGLLQSTHPVRAARVARAVVAERVLATASDRVTHAKALTVIGRRTEALARLRQVTAELATSDVSAAERVTWRLDYAEVLLAAGRRTLAEQQLERVRILHPQNVRLSSLAGRLVDATPSKRRRGS